MNSERRKLLFAFTLTAALAAPVRVPAQQGPKDESNRRHYRLIDLGTLGGPASYLPNGFDGILNNHGLLSGAADTSVPDPNPAFCAQFDCFVSHAIKWQDGVLTDLGALPGVNSSFASWTSSNGLIAGTSQNGEIDPLLPGFPEFRAVLWKGNKIIDLGTLEGGYESLSNAVNSRGQVVGFSLNRIPDPFSLQGPGFLPTQTRAFLWENGTMQDLGTLGGSDASASLINQRGQIVGYSYTDSTPNPITGVPTANPFLWENGKMHNLGTLGGTFGLPTGLNNDGQVVGTSNLAGDLTSHPFLWDDGLLKDLGTLGGNNGVTNWINDEGDIAGKADLSGPVPQNHDAVLWKDGVMIDLGVVPGDSCSNAYFVNSRGQVVGTSESRSLCLVPTGEHAFLWEDGGPMIDLNTLVPPGSSLKLTFAVAINDRGEIAGFGVPPSCLPRNVELCGHAYVLIPCEENDEANCREEEDMSKTVPALKEPKENALPLRSSIRRDNATARQSRIGRRSPLGAQKH